MHFTISVELFWELAYTSPFAPIRYLFRQETLNPSELTRLADSLLFSQASLLIHLNVMTEAC